MCPVIGVRILGAGIVVHEFVFRQIKQVARAHFKGFAVQFEKPPAARKILQNGFGFNVLYVVMRIGVLIAECGYIEVGIRNGAELLVNNKRKCAHIYSFQ